MVFPEENKKAHPIGRAFENKIYFNFYRLEKNRYAVSTLAS